MCQVCDAAEAARNIHSDGRWRQAAGAACAGLSSFLAEVNQHDGMYRKLRGTMERWGWGGGSEVGVRERRLLWGGCSTDDKSSLSLIPPCTSLFNRWRRSKEAAASGQQQSSSSSSSSSSDLVRC